jgi:hypothetical protein
MTSMPNRTSKADALFFAVALLAVLAIMPGDRGVAADEARDAVRTSPTGEPQPLPGAKPVREFIDPEGRTCRVYAREIMIAGAKQSAFATVCREANGRWVLSR